MGGFNRGSIEISCLPWKPGKLEIFPYKYGQLEFKLSPCTPGGDPRENFWYKITHDQVLELTAWLMQYIARTNTYPGEDPTPARKNLEELLKECRKWKMSEEELRELYE
jgi:hypothetical protein